MQYQIVLKMRKGAYQFMLKANCVFEADYFDDNSRVRKRAEELASAVNAFLSVQDEEIIVEIGQNEWGFTDTDLYDFKWYDNSLVNPKSNYGFFAPKVWISLPRKYFVRRMIREYGRNESFRYNAYELLLLSSQSEKGKHKGVILGIPGGGKSIKNDSRLNDG